MRRSYRRPLIALLLLVLWLAVNTLAGRAPEGATTIAAVITQGIAVQFVAASALLVGAAVLLRWPDLGFARPGRDWPAVLWLPGVYLLLIPGAVIATGLPPASVMLILLVNVALGSFSEEVMFRGFLYAGLRDRLSIWPAIFVTTFLFGSVHILNAFLIGNVAAATLQSLAAMMSGFMFLAIRLRLRSIWPSILFHAAWNYGLVLIGRDASPLDPDMPIPVMEVLITFLAILPLGVYPFWLLRRVRRDGDGLGPVPSRPPPLGASWPTPSALPPAPQDLGPTDRRPLVRGVERTGETADSLGDRNRRFDVVVGTSAQGGDTMADASGIKEHMEVIGADGVHVGTVDGIEGDRIKLTKKDSGAAHEGHHHYIPLGLVADVEGDRVRLSATGANAAEMFEEEEDRSPRS